MLFEILHVLVDVYNVLLYVFLEHIAEEVHCFCKFCIVLPYHFFIFLELPPDVCKELLEELLVVQYQFVDNCFVQVNAWELVGVTFIDH